MQKVYEKQRGNKSKTAPGMAFLHIPSTNYEDAWKVTLTDPTPHIHGSINEKICAPEKNTGTFQLTKKLSSAKAVFAGHDHSNDFAAEYQGIILAYGIQTGICETDPYAGKMSKGPIFLPC